MSVEDQLEVTEWADQQGLLLQVVHGAIGCLPAYRAGEGEFSLVFLCIHKRLGPYNN